MNLKAWEFLRTNHQWFLLFSMFCLFVGSLVFFVDLETVENTFKTSKEVEVVVDGVSLNVKTRSATAEDILKELGIYIGEDDLVVPGADAIVNTGDSIEVLRITKEFLTEQKKVAVETVFEERKDMEVGKKVEVQKGQEGILELTTEVVFVNGEEQERNIVAEELVQEPKNRVVALGIKDIITRDGVTFSVSKVIDSAELTAYSAGFVHTGKNPGDKWYGRTATGTYVQEGRTVAVDPKTIPLGWWMYIEGYGFRRAEDTGGAVKNKRIDMYFDEGTLSKPFGLKKGVKVWVIGPNDPRQ
ncbi:hypothetical protein BHU72_11030 [Desulfuribacillus stibiiarsenatis]|uniref:G5 domain-containing protein n=1 Tax=Desulfuribacillus stibiiarsenatis TaxID=1390249 RepID=A0A1E5L2P3_9FIRM|nr:3D domain-containing protein [Desulfuribacillus stibiiarsenatis]OEH84331.1 hypothetical protein BHU72_11030 [Desulfuribacillus stibiiarsenatis]